MSLNHILPGIAFCLFTLHPHRAATSDPSRMIMCREKWGCLTLSSLLLTPSLQRLIVSPSWMLILESRHPTRFHSSFKMQGDVKIYSKAWSTHISCAGFHPHILWSAIDLVVLFRLAKTDPVLALCNVAALLKQHVWWLLWSRTEG